jgi:ubiquinol-cytochrome c reductase iron-sulfur subunit
VRATSLFGAATTLGAGTPFLESLAPSARAKAAGAPQRVDIGKLAPGELHVVEWRGKPVWVLRRTDQMLADIRKDDGLVSDPHSAASKQPAYARNEFRSRDPRLFVVIGVCTHLGCSPVMKPASAKDELGASWHGGFYCPCHGSKFDFAGRVLRGSPAPTNLVVPPYRLADTDTLVIGTAS